MFNDKRNLPLPAISIRSRITRYPLIGINQRDAQKVRRAFDRWLVQRVSNKLSVIELQYRFANQILAGRKVDKCAFEWRRTASQSATSSVRNGVVDRITIISHAVTNGPKLLDVSKDLVVGPCEWHLSTSVGKPSMWSGVLTTPWSRVSSPSQYVPAAAISTKLDVLVNGVLAFVKSADFAAFIASGEMIFSDEFS